MLRFTNFLRVFVLLDILLVGAANQESEFRRQSLNLSLQMPRASLQYQDSVTTLRKQVNALTAPKKLAAQARLL